MYVSVKKFAVKAVPCAAFTGMLLLVSSPTMAQEVVNLTDPNQYTIADLPGPVMNIIFPTDNPLAHWTAQRISDCTSGAGTPFVMFSNGFNNYVMTASDGWLMTLPFDQQYHCSTPANQLPYAFGIETAGTGLANVRGQDGEVRQQNVITSVYLRHIATNSYFMTNGIGPITLGPVPTALSFNVVGTTVPASYLQMFASEFETMKQTRTQAAQQPSNPAAIQSGSEPACIWNQSTGRDLAGATSSGRDHWPVRKRIPTGSASGSGCYIK